ncbi:hypothetical protein M2140_000070 [Clostridiales Family XIII bacterium PM5-7]
MELINGYWVDGNNNRWDSIYFSESKAFLFSSSLVNCENCIDCFNCTNCFDCVDCKNCSNCRGCEACEYCEYHKNKYMLRFSINTKGR